MNLSSILFQIIFIGDSFTAIWNIFFHFPWWGAMSTLFSSPFRAQSVFRFLVFNFIGNESNTSYLFMKSYLKLCSLEDRRNETTEGSSFSQPWYYSSLRSSQYCLLLPSFCVKGIYLVSFRLFCCLFCFSQKHLHKAYLPPTAFLITTYNKAFMSGKALSEAL